MSFLGAFSESFAAALQWWPLLAFILTLPILVVRTLRGNRVTWPYLSVSYLLVLYVLGLGFFTLYPMPDNPAAYCATHATQAQLIPFHWIADVAGPHRLHAVFQLLANVAFFVPLGAFGWALPRGNLTSVAIVGFATSLLIETAQLTGIFGLYPCSFRLFDVDDLVVNTLGAVLGYLLFRFLGVDVDAARFSAPPVPPTWGNRLLAWTVDLLLVMVATAATQVAFVLVTDGREQLIFTIALAFWTALLIGVGQWRHATPGELLVGIKKDADPV